MKKEKDKPFTNIRTLGAYNTFRFCSCASLTGSSTSTAGTRIVVGRHISNWTGNWTRLLHHEVYVDTTITRSTMRTRRARKSIFYLLSRKLAFHRQMLLKGQHGSPEKRKGRNFRRSCSTLISQSSKVLAWSRARFLNAFDVDFVYGRDPSSSL